MNTPDCIVSFLNEVLSLNAQEYFDARFGGHDRHPQ